MARYPPVVDFWSRAGSWKVPLHIKLMVSYVFVVGFILLPTLVYVQTRLSHDETERARQEMRDEARAIAARLEVPTALEMRARTDVLLAAFPNRLTVIDAQGNVLGDSARPGVTAPNHGDRPEVRSAVHDGEAWSVRRSATTGEVLLYVAVRVPREGPLAAVVRLSRPMAVVDAAGDDVTRILRNAGAAALSVAVLLSFVAAVVASRPLRRIAEAARLLSEGEFGFTLEVDTHDEIGDVAQAIRSLAAQLKSKLLASGADRAALQALLDDLPVGVVLFDRHQQPDRVNEAARKMLDLKPHIEVARGAELPRLSGQRGAVEHVLREGVTQGAELVPPWRPETTLSATWLSIFDAEGVRTLGLVLIDSDRERERASTQAMLASVLGRLREAAQLTRGHRAAPELVRESERVERALALAAPAPGRVSGVSLRALLAEAEEAAAPLTEANFTAVDHDLPEGEWRVAECDGRVLRALRSALVKVLDALPQGARATLRVSANETQVRVALVGPFGASVSLSHELGWVRPLGADGGIIVGEERREAWFTLARA